MSVEFVNYMGQTVSTVGEKVKRATKAEPNKWHKGWLVEGLPPGSEEKAAAEHEAKQRILEKQGKATAVFDRAFWIMSAKAKAVRAKPYEVEEAAKDCAALVEKAGWLRVRIIEKKSE